MTDEISQNGDNRLTEPGALVDALSRKVVGQPEALRFIVPYVHMYQAGLAPEDRPVGIFLLLGPTGTGKTRTVEALADVLHSSPKCLLQINCGEFQSDHEIAKLIGAPPGYVGHRETRPLITQQALEAVTTPGCDLSLVLFDEIEKAAPALTPLLLGIFDKARLQLGDGSTVNFSRTLIFLTSNLGAREMLRELQPGLGFQGSQRPAVETGGRLESIGLAAVRKRFSPEFVNRLDVVVTYRPLDAEATALILDQHITELQLHVHSRLGTRSFEIEVTPEARSFLLRTGTSTEYGARELKRTIHRHLTQPLAMLVASGRIQPGALVVVDANAEGDGLRIEPQQGREATPPAHPVILVVDDHRDLLEWLGHVLGDAGYTVLTAESVEAAREAIAQRPPDAALLDYVLGDGDGVQLALQLVQMRPPPQVVLMTGMELPEEDTVICRKFDFPILRKPFLGDDVLRVIQARVLHGSALRVGGSRAS